MRDEPIDDGRAPAISAAAFLASLAEGPCKRGIERLLWFVRDTTLEPSIWTDPLIGFGRHRYRHGSGREGEHSMAGFSPPGRAVSVHIPPGYRFGETGDTPVRLGKH